MKDSWLHFSRAVLLCAIVSGLLALSGCSRSDAPNTASTTKISGVVQKGPFLPGGKITARPLQPGLPSQPLPDAPTIEGKLGSNGSYELELPWSGPTELKVTGLFHDELAREESKRRTTLSATADVQDDEQLNVNLFTTLTHNRTLALLADDEDNYQDAVTTAHRELSDLLDLDLPDADAIRHLDLTDRTDPELQDANSNLLLFSATVLHEYSVIIPTDA